MIWLESIKERPQDLRTKADEAWGRSVYVWKAWYGSLTPYDSHIAFLGLVPLDFITKRGYWWIELTDPAPSRAILREAKMLFPEFDAALGWETFAHTEVSNPKAARFAEFFGFRLMGQNDNTLYFKGEK